jgi:hypothetical protein
VLSFHLRRFPVAAMAAARLAQVALGAFFWNKHRWRDEAASSID